MAKSQQNINSIQVEQEILNMIIKENLQLQMGEECSELGATVRGIG